MSHPPPRGFTLIELSILLAVLAIGAAIIVPDFIESTRDDLAEKAAQDIMRIQDAAKWAYLASDYQSRVEADGNLSDPRDRIWPGVNRYPTPFGTCFASSAANTRADLISGKYLDASALDDNPWGYSYDAFARTDCSFRVRTRVPLSVAPTLRDLLPNSSCGPLAPGSCGPSGGGLTWCCSDIPRPGEERYLIDQVNPTLEVTSEVCNQLGGTMSGPGGFCTVTNTSILDGGCNWKRQGTCDPGEVLMNTRCAGKYCTPIDIYCCAMKTF